MPDYPKPDNTLPTPPKLPVKPTPKVEVKEERETITPEAFLIGVESLCKRNASDSSSEKALLEGIRALFAKMEWKDK